MAQPLRLQSLLRRLETPSALTWDPIADHLSLLDRGSARYELTLCALFKSQERLRASNAALVLARERIARTAGRCSRDLVPL
jgi:hypothetical protein